MPADRRKLIEVALPLEAINREAAREKSIRQGHPSTLHLWWARRPLATARAVLFAQLVDDPDSTPEAARILDSEQRTLWVANERARLFRLIEELVKWESSGNERVLKAARAEIARSTGGNPPAIIDPFAGGGTIPLEAQRLGLEARASDLNPVAVLINKAMVEIPVTFLNQPPVFTGVAASQTGHWPRAAGLADDVLRYGLWMRDQAEQRIGHLYPKATLPNGSTLVVIAWIWARTLTCPNPACGIEMPLVRTWWLGKKKGKESYVIPTLADNKIEFMIGHDPKSGPRPDRDGTINRTGATCIACGAAVSLAHVRAEGLVGKLGSQLMATVAMGKQSRVYLPPSDDQITASLVDRPQYPPAGQIPEAALGFRVKAYGMNNYSDLFTNRQLVALTTLSDLVGEAREVVLTDALSAGLPRGARLAEGGTGAAAYADAVTTYLAFIVSRLTDYSSSITTWASNPQMEILRNLFARQAIPMSWDFAEGNLFAESSGTISIMARAVSKAILLLPTGPSATVRQADASSIETADGLISTDPPYYDNIGYADLSDFFYVWLRRSLRSTYPALLSTLLVPKSEELVANPFRHGGTAGAQSFFETGFREVFAHARAGARSDFPIAVYYAFKQAEATAGGASSTGWETLLEAMVASGWQITGTWPMRSERAGRMRDVGSNALASSIVLALRPRTEEGETIVDRRMFTAALRETLPEKLHDLLQGSIAAVDLPQAAIGPGMAIFSKYVKVVEADGSKMSVRGALQVINQILGEVLWEQEGEFDPSTRWCLKWFDSFGFEPGSYGEAETNASAFNTSVAALSRSGVLTARGGKVQLLAPDKVSIDYDPREDVHVTLWGVVLRLAKTLDEVGLDPAGRLFARAAQQVDVAAAKELAYLLFTVAERRGWLGIAGLFNGLAASWSDLVEAAQRVSSNVNEPLTTEPIF